MLLYVMRHGEAEDSGGNLGDFGRQLTPRGRKRTADTAAVLARLGVAPDTLLTSPLLRARQTAEIVGEVLGVAAVEAAALACGCDLGDLEVLLEAHSDAARLMIVGHEPDCSNLIGELLGRGRVEVKKGAVACLDVQACTRGGAVLLWLMQGKDLAALA